MKDTAVLPSCAVLRVHDVPESVNVSYFSKRHAWRVTARTLFLNLGTNTIDRTRRTTPEAKKNEMGETCEGQPVVTCRSLT